MLGNIGATNCVDMVMVTPSLVARTVKKGVSAAFRHVLPPFGRHVVSVQLHSLDRMCSSTIYFVVDFKFSNFAMDGVDSMILLHSEQTVPKTGPT